MPTYEYACRACEEHLEVVQSFSEDPLTECPSCGGELRKVFSAAGLIFKGSGWHIKDYSSSAASGARSPSTDGGTKDAGTKDAGTKDAAKPDPSPASTTSTTSTASSSGD